MSVEALAYALPDNPSGAFVETVKETRYSTAVQLAAALIRGNAAASRTQRVRLVAEAAELADIMLIEQLQAEELIDSIVEDPNG